MEDFESVIGLSEIQACKVLASLGYNKIKTTLNSKQKVSCNLKLVTAVRKNGQEIELVLGEFIGLQ